VTRLNNSSLLYYHHRKTCAVFPTHGVRNFMKNSTSIALLKSLYATKQNKKLKSVSADFLDFRALVAKAR